MNDDPLRRLQEIVCEIMGHRPPLNWRTSQTICVNCDQPISLCYEELVESEWRLDL